MESLLSDLMEWLKLHPHWAGLVVMIVSALESFLVVGLFVPGTVVMFGIGAMIAAGSMELLPTLGWAIVGAVLGDGASYFIGRHYHQHLRVMWPFRNHPRMIARGVDFFHRHGGKSILLARFVGPVRPLVPAVAGMLNMPVRRFLVINILSAFIWAPVYIVPGILFGASLGVAMEIAGRLAVLLVVLLAVLWLSWWLVRRIARSFEPHTKAVQLGILDWSRQHRAIEPLASALLDPDHPEARGMTVLTGLLLLASAAFLVLISHLAPDTLLDNFDLYLFNHLQQLRSPFGDRLLIPVTQLGDSIFLYSFTALISGWLLWRRNWRATLHWLVTVACVALLTWTVKLFTAVQRPPLADPAAFNHAFPSAHASLSVAVYGFLAVLLARELARNWRWVPYSIAVFIVVAIGFSRLYLGVHWFTDVLGGWSLGLAWVALMGIAYRHHAAPTIPVWRFAAISLAAFTLITSIYIPQKIESDQSRYQVKAKVHLAISQAEWSHQGWQALPGWRSDLEGRHLHPMNVQWLGPLDDFKNHLLERGWRQPEIAEPTSLLDMFHSDAPLHELPVLPQVHEGKTQNVLLVSDLAGKNRLLVLRLWETGYRETNSEQPLWIGNISWLELDEHFWLFRFLRTNPDFDSPMAAFSDEIEGLALQRVQRDTIDAQSRSTRWDGTILLLSTPTR
jgi:undecaprenyl-diphosphatase